MNTFNIREKKKKESFPFSVNRTKPNGSGKKRHDDRDLYAVTHRRISYVQANNATRDTLPGPPPVPGIRASHVPFLPLVQNRPNVLGQSEWHAVGG